MGRKVFFTWVFWFTLLIFGMSLPIHLKAKTIRLTYANFPPASTFPCVQMERWKKEIEKRTHNKVQILTFPGGTLLGAKNMFRGVIQGQADIGCLCMSYQPGVFPLTTVIGLPLGFKDSKTASLVLWEIYNKYKPKEFSKVKVITLFTFAPSNIMSKVPIKRLSDLKGLELRASGTASEILELLGATPVSMPMSETPEALQKGIVKGLLSSLEVLKDLNFASYCPYETITNFQVYPFAVVMNKKKWEKLPPDVKKVIDEISKEHAAWTGEYMDNHVKEAIQYAKEKYNAKLFYFSKQDMQKSNKLLKKVILKWKKMANKANLPADEILKDVYKFKSKYEH